VNLALRFVLELCALAAMGRWGWTKHAWVGIAVPLVAISFWGVFNVPGDPSRSGQAPIPVPGMLRLLLEAVLFGFAAWALGQPRASAIFAGMVLLHYALSLDRLRWLLAR